jgi:hypothetical protein
MTEIKPWRNLGARHGGFDLSAPAAIPVPRTMFQHIDPE